MDPKAAALIEFIKVQILRNSPAPIDEDTSLVTSGLVDSLSLPQILVKLEAISELKIPVGRVSPQDFESVRTMLKAAERVGIPRK